MDKTISGKVTILSITPFERVNEHVALQWPEKFVAITMQGVESPILVTFTRKHSGFAESVKVGDTIELSAKYKRVQDYNNVGGQLVVTNCVIGTPKSVGIEIARQAKIAARKAKLGL